MAFYYGTPTNNTEPLRIVYPPKAIALLQIVLGCLYPILQLTFIAFYFHGLGVVQTINALLYEVKTNQIISKANKTLSELIREDFLGFGIYCSVYFLFAIVIAVSFAFFAKLDPLYYVINWTLHSTQLSDESIFVLETMCIPIRITICFFVNREAARIFPMTLAIFYLLLQSLRETLQALQDSGNLVRVPSRINYSHIMLAPAVPLFDIGISLLLGAGLYILVMANYVSLRMFDVLPFGIYLAGPVIRTFVLFLIQAALPSAVLIHNTSTEGLLKAYKLGYSNK